MARLFLVFMTATLLERGTKPLVLLSLFAAAGLTVMTANVWSALPWVSLVTLVVSFLLARRYPLVVAQGSLGMTYLAPGALAFALGDFRLWDLTPWFASLTGMMLATSDPTRWHLPVPWRAPLVAWGLAVAVGWPVVWLREFDFAPSIVPAADLVNNGAGVPPDIVLLWVYGVVLTHGLGLLWVDWLCATFRHRDNSSFLQTVLVPLAIGCGVATIVAAYQSAVDIGFLNPGHWATLRRASGTLMDANPFGMMAALWGGIGVAMLLSRQRVSTIPPVFLLAATAAILSASWFGLWASGSRSALLAGAVVLLFVARAMWPLVLRVGTRRLAPIVVVAVLLGCVALVATGSSVGPWERLSPTLPGASAESLRAFATELWDRNGYGTTAARMIADSPLVGVGVGSFHALVPDVGFELGYGRLEPDNAQNWFRHQLAEFGILGSLGWMVWVILFLRLLFSDRPGSSSGVSAGIVRGVLVSLGLASMVGMPTQNVALALTFWSLAFWYYRLLDHESAEPADARRPRMVVWAGVWLLALSYGVGLAAVSWSDLRPPLRAHRADWNYSYGLYEAELDSSGEEFQWARGRALAVVPLSDRWIEVSAWAHHPDLSERPVRLQVWVDGVSLIDSVRRDETPVIEAVRIPEGRVRVLVEVEVDRTWSPSDYGQTDTRELGPGLRWRFVDP